jgi:hypothetical protein
MIFLIKSIYIGQSESQSLVNLRMQESLSIYRYKYLKNHFFMDLESCVRLLYFGQDL